MFRILPGPFFRNHLQVTAKGFSLEGSAPRSEFIIFMIAGGNHTLIPKLSKIGSSEPIFD